FQAVVANLGRVLLQDHPVRRPAFPLERVGREVQAEGAEGVRAGRLECLAGGTGAAEREPGGEHLDGEPSAVLALVSAGEWCPGVPVLRWDRRERRGASLLQRLLDFFVVLRSGEQGSVQRLLPRFSIVENSPEDG